MKRVLLAVPLLLLAVGCGTGHDNAPSAEALLVSYDQAPSALPYITGLDAVAPHCTENRTDVAYAVDASRRELVGEGYTGNDLDVLHLLGTAVPAVGKKNCTSALIGLQLGFHG